jgi:hypothetical protein
MALENRPDQITGSVTEVCLVLRIDFELLEAKGTRGGVINTRLR